MLNDPELSRADDDRYKYQVLSVQRAKLMQPELPGRIDELRRRKAS